MLEGRCAALEQTITDLRHASETQIKDLGNLEQTITDLRHASETHIKDLGTRIAILELEVVALKTMPGEPLMQGNNAAGSDVAAWIEVLPLVASEPNKHLIEVVASETKHLIEVVESEPKHN
jgi:hypothetical protein